MVAAGLLGVVAYLFMSMGEQVTHMEGRIKDLMDTNDLDYRVRVYMAHPAACFKTFKPVFEELKTNEKLHFPIQLEKLIGKFDNEILVVGKKYGRIFVENIRVEFDEESIPKEKYENEIGIINILYDMVSHSKKPFRKTGRISLAALMSKSFTANKPNMTTCFSERSLLVQEITNEIMTRTCASMGGSLNAESGSCDLASLLGGLVPGPTNSFPQPPKNQASSTEPTITRNTSSSGSTSNSFNNSSKKQEGQANEQQKILDQFKGMNLKELQEKAMKMMQQYMKDE